MATRRGASHPTPSPAEDFPIRAVAKILRAEAARLKEPIVTRLSREGRNPFLVLISTILSLRTKDACTAEATDRLFQLANSPAGMLGIDEAKIARTIYPVGFYKTKAATIHKVCRELIERYEGSVPDSIDELLTLPGVGRKTANLVVGLGYGKPAICVDTHVHRITNRWGYMKTRTPEETEMALRESLPRQYWIPINDWLVAWGQHVCVPVSPWCSRCPLTPFCGRIGVIRSR